MAARSPIYLGGGGASPADVTDEDLVRWQDRVLFGSDFPNTPHPYEEERRPIWERALPSAVHRKIFFENARRLLDLEPDVSARRAFGPSRLRSARARPPAGPG